MFVENLRRPAGRQLMRITGTESYRTPEIGNYIYHRATQSDVGYLTDMLSRRLPALIDPEETAWAFISLVVTGPVRMAWGNSETDDVVDRRVCSRVRFFMAGIGQGAPALK